LFFKKEEKENTQKMQTFKRSQKKDRQKKGKTKQKQ